MQEISFDFIRICTHYRESPTNFHQYALYTILPNFVKVPPTFVRKNSIYESFLHTDGLVDAARRLEKQLVDLVHLSIKWSWLAFLIAWCPLTVVFASTNAFNNSNSSFTTEPKLIKYNSDDLCIQLSQVEEQSFYAQLW